jgi:hypothetical protein
MTASTIQTSNAAHREPVLALPTGRLVGVTLAACALSGSGSSLLAQLVWKGQVSAMVGPAAGMLVTVAMLIGLLAIMPWKPRPVGIWPTLWLASTVLRLLLTPVLTYLLYSAAPFSAAALAINVVVAYALALAGEVTVVAGFLKRTFPA